jgi:hypothetical protein
LQTTPAPPLAAGFLLARGSFPDSFEAGAARCAAEFHAPPSARAGACLARILQTPAFGQPEVWPHIHDPPRPERAWLAWSFDPAGCDVASLRSQIRGISDPIAGAYEGAPAIAWSRSAVIQTGWCKRVFLRGRETKSSIRHLDQSTDEGYFRSSGVIRFSRASSRAFSCCNSASLACNLRFKPWIAASSTPSNSMVLMLLSSRPG